MINLSEYVSDMTYIDGKEKSAGFIYYDKKDKTDKTKQQLYLYVREPTKNMECRLELGNIKKHFMMLLSFLERSLTPDEILLFKEWLCYHLDAHKVPAYYRDLVSMVVTMKNSECQLNRTSTL